MVYLENENINHVSIPSIVYQKDPDKYFVPINGEKRLPWLLRKLYVAPFSPAQIQVYVEQHNQLNVKCRGGDREADYHNLDRIPEVTLDDFYKIPGLKN